MLCKRNMVDPSLKVTPLMLYALILYMSGETLLIFEKLFLTTLFALRGFARYLVRESRRRNIFLNIRFIGEA